ncbi:MAG: AbrB/MazE/SpoVT family DNA-binding domain-containing protein [Microbacteriaceae bacterium]
MGDRGRVVVPLALRRQRNWSEGTKLLAVDTERGVILTGRREFEDLISGQLARADLVAQLIEERRAASLREDEA